MLDDEKKDYDLIASDLEKVDDIVAQQTVHKLDLINAISQYVLTGGGKKLRPAICLLSYYAIGAQKDDSSVTLAAAIELIHTATLLHDDVVDQSDLRRGNKAAHLVWGNEACILIGDFLYSRAFQLIASLKNNAITKHLAQTTNTIAEGEVAQFAHKSTLDIGEKNYIDIISKKTAVLFVASTHSSALLARAPQKIVRALYDYGYNLGIAFQLIDDLLDYNPNRHKKVAGDDLANGKLTLPTIHAMQSSRAAQQDVSFIRDAFQNKTRSALTRLLEIMQTTDSLGYVYQKAQTYTEEAIRQLSCLPDSPYKDTLASLARLQLNNAKLLMGL